MAEHKYIHINQIETRQLYNLKTVSMLSIKYYL